MLKKNLNWYQMKRRKIRRRQMQTRSYKVKQSPNSIYTTSQEFILDC